MLDKKQSSVMWPYVIKSNSKPQKRGSFLKGGVLVLDETVQQSVVNKQGDE
jgi:hypothetical protein